MAMSVSCVKAPILKISRNIVYDFLCNPTYRQADRQTDKSRRVHKVAGRDKYIKNREGL